MAEPASLASAHTAAHEEVIRRFEEAWRAEQRPKLERFLVGEEPERTRLLIELIHVDLEFRLRRGESARVEEYLERYPSLTDDRAALLDLIVAEFKLRRRLQAGTWPEEFLLRFPQFLLELPEQLCADASTIDVQQPGQPLLQAAQKPQIPGFEIMEVLGHGGMGLVFKARQVELDRIVALKMMRIGYAATPADLARFRREAEAIAQLDHPHIVPVYEVGQHHGCPYFTMRYYPGGSLQQQIVGPAADLRAAAQEIEIIARAVHHAHERGVLHRDLKPSNILLDNEGQPHVADFGLAKRFQPEVGETQASAIVGTPAYMAPEQVRGARRATTASDVYSLGAVLYQRLTGAPPFQADSALETLMQAMRDPPARPRTLNPRVPVDLETICLKALEKTPERRYVSALALAEDLQRWRAGRPVRARPVGTLARAWRWTRRHPLAAALTASTALALLLFFATLVVANMRIAAKQREVSQALTQERAARRELGTTLDELERTTYVDRIALAYRLWQDSVTGNLDALLASCPARLRHWEWHYLNHLRSVCWKTLRGHSEIILAVVYSPDGSRLASADLGGTIKIWNAREGTELFELRAGTKVADLAFSPDGARLAAATPDAALVWDLGARTKVFDGAGGAWVEFHPDGGRIATGAGTDVLVHDLGKSVAPQRLAGHQGLVRCGVFSADGALLVTGGDDQWVRFWDLGAGQPARPPCEIRHGISALAWAAGGKKLLVGARAALFILDSATGQQLAELSLAPSTQRAVAANPANSLIARAGHPCSVSVRALDDANDRQLSGHSLGVWAVAFHPDGRHLASAGADRVIHLWDLERGLEFRKLQFPADDNVVGLGFDPAGRVLAVAAARYGSENRGADAVQLFELATGRPLHRLRGANSAVFSPCGKYIATGGAGGAGGAPRLWDAATGAEVRAFRGYERECTVIGFSPDGRRLITAGDDNTVRIWDPATGAEIRRFTAQGDWLNCVALSPDGSRVAALTQGETVEIWDTATATLAHAVKPPHLIRCLIFAPDGQSLVSGGRDRAVHIWDPASGQSLRAFHGHTGIIWSVALSRDGRRLVSGGMDETVRLWDVDSGRELLSLPGASGFVQRVAFSPDGARICAGGQVLRIWEAAAPTGSPHDSVR